MTNERTRDKFRGNEATDTVLSREQSKNRRTVVSLVLALSLACAGAAAWVAWQQNQDTTRNILRVQTSQAGEVLISAIPSIVDPLDTAGELAANSHDPATLFRAYLESFVTPKGFADASLWILQRRHLAIVASVGARPDLQLSSAAGASLSRRAVPCAASFAVIEVAGPGLRRFGYACTVDSRARRFFVYAERPLPVNRRAKVASNSAFSELRYAIYFGRTTSSRALVATDFSSLPPAGITDQVSVPFGDSWLTLVTSPSGSLAGTLSDDLPWLIGTAGVVLSVLLALVANSLIRRRQTAELANVRIGSLLTEQRTIAGTLQRSLLPLRTPSIPGVEIEARYVPSSDQMEVGGDWYSVVQVDDQHFGVVVGDVSGHGVESAAVMAALRFTIRTLILEGHSPDIVLDRCAAQVPDLLRGHYATVFVALADLETRRVAMANAGHLNPLLMSATGSEYLETVVGVPMGVPRGNYQLSSFVMPRESTLFSFTDGLVERRGVSLDAGLERLRTLAQVNAVDLNALLTEIVEHFGADHVFEDDIALLAVRWH